MEVLGSGSAWKRNTVASSITLWELVVNSGSGVEWLMDITGIVDQKSESGGKSLFLRGCVIVVRHDLCIDVRFIVISILGHPCFDGRNSLSDIVGVSYEIWEIRDLGTCIIKIRLINEMPS